jgi:hypothetical protein
VEKWLKPRWFRVVFLSKKLSSGGSQHASVLAAETLGMSDSDVDGTLCAMLRSRLVFVAAAFACRPSPVTTPNSQLRSHVG